MYSLPCLWQIPGICSLAGRGSYIRQPTKNSLKNKTHARSIWVYMVYHFIQMFLRFDFWLLKVMFCRLRSLTKQQVCALYYVICLCTIFRKINLEIMLLYSLKLLIIYLYFIYLNKCVGGSRGNVPIKGIRGLLKKILNNVFFLNFLNCILKL